MKAAPRQLETGFYLQLFSYSLPQWRTADLFYRDREKGHLMGRMDGAGGRARGRSSRQLLGHCLPGVCISVISQSLSSLASYRRTHKCNPPNTDLVPALPCLSPSTVTLSAPSCSDSVEQVRFTEAQVLYIDTLTSCQPLQPAFLSNLWRILSGAVGWMCHSGKAHRNSLQLGTDFFSVNTWDLSVRWMHIQTLL